MLGSIAVTLHSAQGGGMEAAYKGVLCCRVTFVRGLRVVGQKALATLVTVVPSTLGRRRERDNQSGKRGASQGATKS